MTKSEEQGSGGGKRTIAIVGAGIIGVSIACRLVREHDQMLLVDPHRLCMRLHERYSEAGGQTLRTRIENIETPGDGSFVLRHDGGRIEAGKLILAADLAAGRKPAVDLSPFRPDRF